MHEKNWVSVDASYALAFIARPEKKTGANDLEEV